MTTKTSSIRKGSKECDKMDACPLKPPLSDSSPDPTSFVTTSNYISSEEISS